MANFNEAFTYTVKSKEIYSSNDLQNDNDYINSDKQMYDKYGNYQNKNYRYNPQVDYQSKVNEIYDLQGISDGKGPGRNINADDTLTRGNMLVKPLDKLAESVNFGRYVYPSLNKCTDFNNKSFLISTSQSCEPQPNFNGGFDIQGTSDRNFNRKSEKFYKKK